MPLSTLQVTPHDAARKTRGQDGFAVLLSCRALSSPTTCRFIPAHSELPTIRTVAESGDLSDVFVLRSAEFLGESDEEPFRPADVAEPIRVFILDYFAYELRAALAELFKRLVDVVHGEHDTEVA